MGQSMSSPPEEDHLTKAKAAFNDFYADEKRNQCLSISVLSAQLNVACDTFLLVSAYEEHSRGRIWEALQATDVADVDKRTRILQDEQESFTRQLNGGNLVTMLPKPPDLNEDLGVKLRRIKDADALLNLTGVRSMSLWDGAKTPIVERAPRPQQASAGPEPGAPAPMTPFPAAADVSAAATPAVSALPLLDLPDLTAVEPTVAHPDALEAPEPDASLPVEPTAASTPMPTAAPADHVYNRLNSTMNEIDNGGEPIVLADDDLSIIDAEKLVTTPDGSAAPPGSPASPAESAEPVEPAKPTARPAPVESRHNRALTVRSLKTLAEYQAFRDSVKGPANVMRYCETEIRRKPAKLPAHLMMCRRPPTKTVMFGRDMLAPRLEHFFNKEKYRLYRGVV